MQAYSRDPRGVAKRAEAYLKATRHRRHRVLRPGARILHLRSGALRQRHGQHLLRDRLRRSGVELEPEVRRRQHRLSSRRQGRLLPGRRRSTRCTTSAPRCARCSSRWACEVEVHHHEVATAGQCEIGTRSTPWCSKADELLTMKYVVKNVAHRNGKTATFMPKPHRRRQRHAACTCTSRWPRAARTCSPATATAACRRLALWYIGGIFKHARAINAFANSTTNSYKRLVPGLRSAGDAGLFGAQPLGLVPHSVGRQPEGAPHRDPLPGSDATPAT